MPELTAGQSINKALRADFRSNMTMHLLQEKILVFMVEHLE